MLCPLDEEAARTNLHLLEVEQLRLAGLVSDVINLVSKAAKHSATAGFVDIALVHAHISAHLLQHLVTCLSQAEVQPAPYSSSVLWLPLGLEAPVMTPKDVIFCSFFKLSLAVQSRLPGVTALCLLLQFACIDTAWKTHTHLFCRIRLETGTMLFNI